jgi:hypothetical protein
MRTIVWDVDDVLNDFTRSWLETVWRPARPACRLTYDGLAENPPHRLLGVTLETYLASLDAYRVSPEADALAPVPEVMDWFARFGDRFRHIALTARPLDTVPPASAWVFRHFGRWIRTFHFVPAARTGPAIPRYDLGKDDFLRWLGKGDVFLDDSTANVEAVTRLGMTAFLVPRPWNAAGRALADILSDLAEKA